MRHYKLCFLTGDVVFLPRVTNVIANTRNVNVPKNYIEFTYQSSEGINYMTVNKDTLSYYRTLDESEWKEERRKYEQ